VLQLCHWPNLFGTGGLSISSFFIYEGLKKDLVWVAKGGAQGNEASMQYMYTQGRVSAS
jgi:hypothetical protein